MPLATVENALRGSGLIPRGGFQPAPADAVPVLADGAPVATLVLVGNAGPALWRASAAEFEAPGGPDPLDQWTRKVVDRVAAAVDATALFPFDGPPYPPFQRWAQRAESVWPSPLGILIHPRYGLWHAYRAALAFRRRVALPPAPPTGRSSPCATCAARPCLEACPVKAFTGEGYDVAACRAHIASPLGGCLEDGCAARLACPEGRAYGYDPAQNRFHMRAFLRA